MLKICPSDKPAKHMPRPECDTSKGKCRIWCTKDSDCDVENGGVCYKLKKELAIRGTCGYRMGDAKSQMAGVGGTLV